MKNVKLKKIIYTLAGGIFGIALFVSLSGVVRASLPDMFHSREGGRVGIDQFQMSRKKSDREGENRLHWQNSVLREGNEKAIFRLVGSSMFSNIISFGQTRFNRLAVGRDKGFNFNQGDTALQVDGYITIKSLAHDGSQQVKACINDFGVIVACDGSGGEVKGESMTCTEKGIWADEKKECSPVNYDPKEKYSEKDTVCVDKEQVSNLNENDPDKNCGEAGASYKCVGKKPANASICKKDDQNLEKDTEIRLGDKCTSKFKCEYICEKDYTYDPDKKLCVQEQKIDGRCGKAQGGTYSSVPPSGELCDAGTASSVTTNTSSYTWTCLGSGGGASASCTAKRDSGNSNTFSYQCIEDQNGATGGWVAYSENGDNTCPPLNYPTFDQQTQYDLNDIVCSPNDIENDQCYGSRGDTYKCTEDQGGATGGWVAYSENGDSTCPPLNYPTYDQQGNYSLNDIVCSINDINNEQCYAS